MLNEGPRVPTPQEFAQSVAQSDGYEMAAARAALTESRAAPVRTFAEQMLADHARTSQSIAAAAKASGLEEPKPHVGGDQARFLMALQSLRGAEFDREYARQQVMAHTSALTTVRGYADKGTDANLKRAAAAATPIIEHHLQMARQLQGVVGGG